MSPNSEADMKVTANLDEIEHGSGSGEKTLVGASGQPEEVPRGHIHSLDVRITKVWRPLMLLTNF